MNIQKPNDTKGREGKPLWFERSGWCSVQVAYEMFPSGNGGSCSLPFLPESGCTWIAVKTFPFRLRHFTDIRPAVRSCTEAEDDLRLHWIPRYFFLKQKQKHKKTISGFYYFFFSFILILLWFVLSIFSKIVSSKYVSKLLIIRSIW